MFQRKRPRDWEDRPLKRPKYVDLRERARKAGDHSLEKLAILDYYLGYRDEDGRGGGFLHATQSAPDRVYIDGFAGPGLVRLGKGGPTTDASPMIALGAAIPGSSTARSTDADGRVRLTKCFFAEKEKKDRDALAERLQPFDAKRWRIFEGDFNEGIDAMLQQVHPSAPAIAFLDAEDSDDLAFEAIRRIAATPRNGNKIELLINLPIGRLRRRGDDALGLDKRLERMMGVSVAPALMAKDLDEITWAQLRDELLATFVRQLDLSENGLGYRFVSTHPLPAGDPIYYLVFATDHEAGAQIMNAAFRPMTNRRRDLQIKLPWFR